MDQSALGSALTAVDLDRTGSVLDRLDEVAARLPDQLAVTSADGDLSWAELHHRTCLLADELDAVLPGTADGGGPAGDRENRRPIGIFAAQGTDAVAAALAVVATGRPFVLLDVLLPDARVGQLAQQAGVTVVLADDLRRPRAAGLPGVEVVRGLVPCAGDVDAGTSRAGRLSRPDVRAGDSVSIIFTSGTTGAPKGIDYLHRTVLANTVIGRDWMRFGPTDRVALVMPWAFAAGQELMLMALLNGATLCVRDPREHGIRDLAAWLAASRVTTLHGTPSLLRALVAVLPPDQVLPSLRLVTTAGERVHGRDVTAVRQHLDAQASVLNYLGSSETGIYSRYEVAAGDPAPDGVVPAGAGGRLREITVLDDAGRPVSAGETGFLHVTSGHLSGGYWDDPEQTAARFSPLPDGRTRYASGDRARIDADGVLHVLGRGDDAVKIRGYQVEPAEVEVALRALPEVRDAVVRALPDGEGRRLVAWVVPDPRQRPPSTVGVRTELARTLPDWMVPRDVVLMTELPRNTGGKVDVAALPAPAPRPAPVPPVTDAERRLEQLWAPLLRVEHVGRTESFTALGGDSLSVEEMLAALPELFGTSLTAGDLAEDPTLAGFAARLERGAPERSRRSRQTVLRLRGPGSRPPVFCFAGAGGAAAAFADLAELLGPDQPVTAFQARGFEGRGVPDWSVSRTARRHLEDLERLAPEGPVVLVGHSLGGLVALKVAHLLAARGRVVPLVVLLDTYLPPAARPAGTGHHALPEVAPAAGRRDLWRTRVQVALAGIWRHADPAVHREVFHQHGVRVAHLHRPTAWPGRTVVFMSNENLDEPEWWDLVLTGEHEVRQVDCDHLAMLRRPYVDGVAEQLAPAVEALRTGRSAG
ncbi:alpha/beta fold hydrolase [Modestobacter sp. VKM Ac-2986]|uniref:alpha/beta fold hydrolase n=1 Tax=Modestobacter sp. VKM Ac-2986 TaxID=3004140 RepID=UPI0022AB72EB|nr:alpha/beta fold hydrolase [Modestobacter sp. VKM Ac-2986]MCZ2829859.1 alpha/beta fold hydrolase [Modestobacter sp. VKM Ac-2986]